MYPSQRSVVTNGGKKNGGRELVDGRKGEGGDGQALLERLAVKGRRFVLGCLPPSRALIADEFVPCLDRCTSDKLV
jgi:hypothetical protein